ncbi:MAG TPA: sugar phosphate isomerase/epimerase [Bacteroidales bacterium]|nr:sugar phosphate isomerase/epimerase [Bacteroidales bacterium]
MKTRREFLKSTGLIAFAGFIMPRVSFEQMQAGANNSPAIGLQLYTLGNLMVTDPLGTLKKLAEIGYKEIESAGSTKGNYYGFKPEEFSSIVKDAGMTWRSAHVGGAPFTMRQVMKMAKTAEDSARIKKMSDEFKNRAATPNLTDNYQQLADEAARGGIKYLVCASIPVSSMDEIKKAVDVFNKAGEACKKNGVEFAYHNHQTEFDNVDGQRPFDYILDNTDEDLVKMELDLAWATKAGQDPVKLFDLHPGRYPLWHVKDLDKENENPAEAGSGIVDFKRIFDNAGKSGMKYFFVEQDGAPQPFENVTNSYNYLAKLLKKS